LLEGGLAGFQQDSGAKPPVFMLHRGNFPPKGINARPTGVFHLLFS
jgi:hypothetical protein